MDTSWNKLVRSALLGTDRYPLPEDVAPALGLPPDTDPARVLLHALAYYGQLQLGAKEWESTESDKGWKRNGADERRRH